MQTSESTLRTRILIARLRHAHAPRRVRRYHRQERKGHAAGLPDKTTDKDRASPRHGRSLPENPPQTKATADPGPPGGGILHSWPSVGAHVSSVGPLRWHVGANSVVTLAVKPATL